MSVEHNIEESLDGDLLHMALSRGSEGYDLATTALINLGEGNPSQIWRELQNRRAEESTTSQAPPLSYS